MEAITINKHTQRSRGRPKQAKDDLSIQEVIIATASKLFLEMGYETLSLHEIAKACNVSKPTIYYYFTSKSELLKVAIITMLKNVHRNTMRLLNETDNVEAGLILVAEARIASPHIKVEMLLKEAESSLSEEQLQQIRDAEQRVYLLLSDFFQAAMDKGLLRKDDPLFLAYTFSTMLLISNREDTMHLHASHLELAKKVVGLFLKGTLA
ncbi:TetR/AcrR family transcriptional regulator [Paenibacillus septentrionalis]|uniref:TetR/AcrR family transcriptional regulator n=1 Tax=Paenibacillus septentrionalis TaxID=429342 RepID=A0ABW1UZR8_9BACL